MLSSLSTPIPNVHCTPAASFSSIGQLSSSSRTFAFSSWGWEPNLDENSVFCVEGSQVGASSSKSESGLTLSNVDCADNGIGCLGECGRVANPELHRYRVRLCWLGLFGHNTFCSSYDRLVSRCRWYKYWGRFVENGKRLEIKAAQSCCGW